MKKHGVVSTVTTEGGLLPSGLLKAVMSGQGDLAGTKPTDYHLGAGERINEAISRSYSRLANAWKGFQKGLEGLPENDLATTITRERWLLILFQELGYGRLMTSSAFEIEGKFYPISHFWHKSPIHLVGIRVNLDRRTARVAGAARTSPHSLVQEFLNRSEEHLWGFVANGLILRILRDNASMTRQSYVEFDLAAMMEGEIYADFALMWMLCHQSRVEAENAHGCWLEQWAKQAQDQGSRILEKLRGGVENAISCLGSGFLAHPANLQLKEALRSGGLSTQDYYRQLLRLVYRFLFLFVAEDRNLLLSPKTDNSTREVYERFYSMSRIRNMAGKRKGTRHADLYEGVKQVMGKLAEDAGCPELGLACLGGFLWSEESIPDLVCSHIMNQDLLDAVRVLTFFVDANVLMPVDYKNLGSEELGSIYESLLELHAEANADSATFILQTAGGNERKTTGSYYTHPSLVQCLLDSALEPVLTEAIKKSHPEEAILSLKVCDPACGSGHFLVAASHRMAKKLAMVRTGDEEPAPEEVRTALRDVIGRCIYGVDINPMAVELCKVSLWMEALEPGKPLSFLDHRILCGNSLLGTTPALIRDGIPDVAFKPIEGDDKEFCKAFKKRNKEERTGQKSLFGHVGKAWQGLGDCHLVMAHVDNIEDSTPRGIREKEEQYKLCVTSYGFQHAKLVADAWCASFVWKKKEIPGLPEPITHELFKELENNPRVLPKSMEQEIHRLSGEYAFFHWHLAFPDVFFIPEKYEEPDNEQTGWSGGFDCVLGNPPWDKLTPDSKEFFSQYDESVRFSNRASEREIVDELLKDVSIKHVWISHRRKRFCEVFLIKESGLYQMFAPGNLGKGDLNTYRFFVELALITVAPNGSVAQVVPEGLYNGANSAAIRQALFGKFNLKLLYGFVNAHKIWFDGIDSRTKFCIYTTRRTGKTESFKAAFNIRSPEELLLVKSSDSLSIPVSLVVEFSPDALSLLEFRSQKDIDISIQMYERQPKLGDESAGEPLHSQSREIDMTNDAELFCEDANYFPLYEGRMVDQYDHRAKGYVSGRARAAVWKDLKFDTKAKVIQPQWRIMPNQIPEKNHNRVNRFRIGYGWVASPTNERSLISALLPPNTIAGNSVPTIMYSPEYEWMYILWLATANSFTLDFLVRMKVSLNLTFTLLKSLPFPRAKEPNELVRLLAPYVLELTCTSEEMVGFWKSMTEIGLVPSIGENAEVMGANKPARRLPLRALVDAIVAHDIFGLRREEVHYIMDTFPIVEEKDRKQFGEFRTKKLILSAFDGMQQRINTNEILAELLKYTETGEEE